MSASDEYLPTLQEDTLPSGWSLATIEELVGNDGVFIDGDWVESKDQDPNGDVRLIQLADIGDGNYRNRSARFLTFKKAIELGCTFLEKGDVLIARMPDPLGRACIFPGDSKPAITVVDVAIVRSANGDFNHKWLMYFVNAPAFRAAVASMQSGSTRKRISRGNLSKIVLPVPPLDQQKRIVAEIEKQFSRLDEAVANLKRVKANLKRYKAAVLKAAVEGRLVETEAEIARREGRSYETGEQLLQSILENRRSQWKGKGKYKEPNAPENTHDPELPEGWCLTALEAIADVIDPNPSHRMPTYVEVGVPFISSENFVGEEGIDFAIGKQVELETLNQQRQKYSIDSGDFVLSRIGTIGKTRFLPVAMDYCLSHALVVIKVFSNQIHKGWLRRTISSDSILSQARKGIQSVGAPDLGMAKIRSFNLPLPPAAEQRRIADEIERRLSLVSEVEAEVHKKIERAERLRQSILYKLFTGDLLVSNLDSLVERHDDEPNRLRFED